MVKFCLQTRQLNKGDIDWRPWRFCLWLKVIIDDLCTRYLFLCGDLLTMFMIYKNLSPWLKIITFNSNFWYFNRLNILNHRSSLSGPACTLSLVDHYIALDLLVIPCQGGESGIWSTEVSPWGTTNSLTIGEVSSGPTGFTEMDLHWTHWLAWSKDFILF